MIPTYDLRPLEQNLSMEYHVTWEWAYISNSINGSTGHNIQNFRKKTTWNAQEVSKMEEQDSTEV